MPSIQLTHAFVQSIRCPLGMRKIDFFDKSQTGFLVEVRASGGKTFYQRYRDERGRERQFKIGPADVLRVTDARRKARKVLASVLLGGDPQQRRQRLRLIPRVSDFVRDRYLPHVRSYKRSWRTDETVLRIHILPTIGKCHLDEVTGVHVAKIMSRLSQKGYASGTSNRVLILLRYVFSLARKWQVCSDLQNPTLGFSIAPDVCRERFLSSGEVGRLLQALDLDQNQTAARAIKLLLFTGARRNEITYAKWAYVDWERRTLLVPRSKCGRPRYVTLNEPALRVLRSCSPTSEYIFPSSVTGRPSPSLFFPWSRIRKRAQLMEVRLHDLRHSFASFLVNNGVSLYVVQGLLGHVHARTTQRYAHLTRETMLQAAESVAAAIHQ